MNVQYMYSSLTDAGRDRVCDLVSEQRRLGDDTTELWENVVRYVYKEETAYPPDWFRWWED